MDVLKNNPSSTHRVYARKSLRPEAKRTDGAWPRISYWVNAQKKWEEYDLEDKWTVEVLKKNLNNNFRGAIDKYTSFTMSPLIEMSEDDFIQAFEEYCKENNRKGHFEESIYKTKSFVFDDK
jgi:Zn-finger domain-containing protein